MIETLQHRQITGMQVQQHEQRTLSRRQTSVHTEVEDWEAWFAKHVDAPLLVTRKMEGVSITVDMRSYGLTITHTATGKPLCIAPCLRKRMEADLDSLRGALFCVLVKKETRNDGRQYSLGASRANNIEKHEFDYTRDAWGRLVAGASETNPVTLDQWNGGYFVLVCFGAFDGDNAEKRMQMVSDTLPSLKIDRDGVLRYPNQPMVACYVYAGVDSVAKLRMLLRDANMLAANGRSAKTAGFVVNILRPNRLVYGVDGASYHTLFSYKMKNQYFAMVDVTAYDKNSNRFRVQIADQHVSSTSVRDVGLRNELRRILDTGIDPRVRGLAVCWYLGYAEVRHFCITRIEHPSDRTVVASVDVDAVQLVGARPVPVAPCVPANIRTVPAVPLFVVAPTPPRAVMSPESRERLLAVMQHNCKHVLGLPWERFLGMYAEASSHKRKRELYHSVIGR